jgi:aspartate/methionine/tyrosine aminotransferase
MFQKEHLRISWCIIFLRKNIRGTEIKNAMDLSMYLLAEANVATVTGDAFGNLTVSVSLMQQATRYWKKH